MTGEELKARLAIADRLAACAQAGDARKADAYAACYTTNGVLELDEPIAGREAIRAWMGAPPVIPMPASGPVFVSHHLTTCHIELTGEGRASARTYWLVTSPAGIDHNGFYDDELREEDGVWLIARRRPRTLWISPDSLLRAAAPSRSAREPG